MIYVNTSAIFVFVSPATLVIRAKTEQTWEAIAGFINWLIRLEKINSKIDSNVGCTIKAEAEAAERIHMLLSYHRLPLTVEMTVEALQ